MKPSAYDRQPGQWIWDVRQEPKGLKVGTGAAKSLPCQRVLMVGTDMAIGKMSAALELQTTCERRGVKSKFIATGQAGMMISGEGVALDAVRVDYAAGSIEQAVMPHGHNYDLLLIEGQGSLLHPGSSATLPLLRGSCPTHLILCHREGMTELPRLSWIKGPPIRDVIGLYEDLACACGTFPAAKVVGLALNTGHLNKEEARDSVARMENELGIPVCDPVRSGAEILLRAITG